MQTEGKQFSRILGQVLDNYGSELLCDVPRFNALLMDFAPNYSKERKLLCTVLRENIISDLRSAASLEAEESERIVNRCIYRLKKDLWLSEDAAVYAIRLLAPALGITLSETQNPESDIRGETSTVLTKGAQIVKQENIDGILKGFSALGYKAFACNGDITEVCIPESIITIYPKAFVNCYALRTVTIPGTIQKIGREVFRGCTQLQSIKIKSSKKYVVLNGALIERDTATLMRVVNDVEKKESIVPQGISHIASFAYDHNTATVIRLSDKIKSIEDDSFFECDYLERITIEGHSNFFKARAGVLYDGSGKVLIKYPPGCKQKAYMLEEGVEKIEQKAFGHALYLESITFNSDLKMIGRRAFEKCEKLDSLILPSCVNEIGERAFQGCRSLRSIMLPRGILEIGDYAFSGCSSITSLSIPASVERIGHGAFTGCTGLQTIIFQKKVCFIGDGVFEGCSKEIVVKVHSNPYVEAYCQAHGMEFERI